MKTLNETLKEFDEKFVEKTFPFLGVLGGQRNYWKDEVDEMKQIDRVKDFISQSIKTALKSVKIKEGDYTWKRTEQEPTDDETTFWEGYNTCCEIVKKNIENYLKN